MELAKEKVETGLSNRLQPWQALFAVLSYSVGVYGIENEKALVLYALLLGTLAIIQLNTYKHQQNIREVVAPWLVEQLLKTIGDYLQTQHAPDIELSGNAKEIKTRLRAQLQEKIDQLTQELEQAREK